MTNKYKLVVSDIDGTLTNVRGEISSTDMATLHRIEQSGVRLAVSTGRAAKGSMPILQMLPAASGFHIFFDGALVCNTALNESIYSRPIEKSLLSGAIELAHTHGLALELFSPDGYFVEADDPLAAAHRDLMRLDWTVCDFTTLCESESIIMGCLVVPTVEESTFRPILSAYAAKAGIRFSWSSHAARPEIRMVNIVMKDVSKGAALRALCKHLRISESETIAIGDGSNDVSLLEAAGLAIAMQNGPPELLAAADYITADVDHSGFTQAMEKFLFNLK